MKRQHKQPNWFWLGRRQTMAVIAVLVTGVVAAVAGVTTAAPVKATRSDDRRVEKVIKLTPAITKKTPVNGEARAADEPPSRSAIGEAVQAAAVVAPKVERRATVVDVERVLKPKTRKMMMEVTAYCACKACCGPNAKGLTASGKRVSYNGGKFVAADTDVLPFGTKIVVPGYNRGRAVPVADRGGAIVGKKLDLYFPTHQEARQWGRQWVEVTVVE